MKLANEIISEKNKFRPSFVIGDFMTIPSREGSEVIGIPGVGDFMKYSIHVFYKLRVDSWN